jgi:GTP-binding protein EngB required for normal cell division
VQDSFERAKQWVEKLRKEVMGRHNKQGLVVAVVANKVDKVDERNRLMRVRSIVIHYHCSLLLLLLLLLLSYRHYSFF